MSPALVPLIALVAAGLAARFVLPVQGPYDPVALASLGGVVTSVAATMLGFLLASLAVLASVNHTHLVRMMRRTGHYRDLLLTVLYGCAGFFASLLLGLALVFGLSFGLVLPDWLGVAIVAAHGAAIASLLDVGRKMWLVLANLRDD